MEEGERSCPIAGNDGPAQQMAGHGKRMLVFEQNEEEFIEMGERNSYFKGF